jgi:hypothetical protein
LKLWVAMSNSVPGTAGQIYWDTGEGFSEGQSASWSLPGDTLMHTYSVSIATSKPVVNLRLDPSRQPDVVSIRRLEVIRAGADRGPSQAQR